VSGHLPIAVAFEGYGWHPEAWRHTPDRESVLSGRYWTGLAGTAERGLLDFVTFDDGLTPQRRRRPDIDPRWLAGRPDAVLVASLVAPTTAHIGLVPVVAVTHADPTELAESIAVLDAVSHGRAGWQPRISATEHEAALFGRRTDAARDLFTDAAAAVDGARALWAAHPPPQGQPVVAALAHNRRVYEFASASADLVFITPLGDEGVRTILDEVADAGGARLRVYADVFVSSTSVTDPRSDAHVFSGGAAELVDLLLCWNRLGMAGFRLRPSVNAIDLPWIVDEVVPLLQSAGRFRESYRPAETLRSRLGLPAVAGHDVKVVAR
jgi:alkanesulfonate monooxygenase SsuD/methylene tetrahydromethanopterin reductase-like flavin-dependent oxidoreductase (luciferase family)